MVYVSMYSVNAFIEPLKCKQLIIASKKEQAKIEMAYTLSGCGFRFILPGVKKLVFSGLLQTIQGLVLVVLSIPRALYHKDFVYHKFAFSQICHGIGNVGVAILELTPVVRRAVWCYRIYSDRMMLQNEKLESFWEARTRILKATDLIQRVYREKGLDFSISNQVLADGMKEGLYLPKPLFSYFKESIVINDELYQRMGPLMTAEEEGKEITEAGSVLFLKNE